MIKIGFVAIFMSNEVVSLARLWVSACGLTIMGAPMMDGLAGEYFIGAIREDMFLMATARIDMPGGAMSWAGLN